MSIKRYTANADTTITNAFESNLRFRGTGSNMGQSDVLEVFSIYGQADSGSTELSRTLVKFPIDEISSDRSSSVIPVSGNVNFVLKVYNARHSLSLPKDYTLMVQSVSRSWEEGNGLDMEGYTDLTWDLVGANWTNAASGTTWTSVGGDYWDDTSSSFSMSFDKGNEDLEIDITTLVEQWLSSSTNRATANDLGFKENYGVGIMLTASNEVYFTTSDGEDSGSVPYNIKGAKESYYTKKFFARGSEYFFKRPVLEAQWDSSIKDNRGSFIISSSLADAKDNLNTLWLYNRVRGQLKNIPSVGTGSIYVRLYTSSSAGENLTTAAPYNLKGSGSLTISSAQSAITGGHVSSGTYSASFAVNTTASTLFDRWFSGSNVYFTGTFDTNDLVAGNTNIHTSYYTTVSNLKNTYMRDESARFRIYVRPKDWSPNTYTVASKDVSTSIIEDAYFRIYRTIDELGVVEYGTGSAHHTRLSYDVSGNYFDFSMDLLEAGFMYGIKLLYKMPDGKYKEQPETFKFRVD